MGKGHSRVESAYSALFLETVILLGRFGMLVPFHCKIIELATDTIIRMFFATPEDLSKETTIKALNRMRALSAVFVVMGFEGTVAEAEDCLFNDYWYLVQEVNN